MGRAGSGFTLHVTVSDLLFHLRVLPKKTAVLLPEQFCKQIRIRISLCRALGFYLTVPWPCSTADQSRQTEHDPGNPSCRSERRGGGVARYRASGVLVTVTYGGGTLRTL
jgi:hypothetical protein